MTCETDTWAGCYDLGWKNIIHPAAFGHPAKYARGLISRIVKHALAEGWVQPGQWILDPFGGVSLGAWACLQHGLNYIGVELEYHFHHLGQGWDCPGFDKATWRRYHGRAQRVYKGRTEWLFCPDCAETIDRIPMAVATMFASESGRMIPAQPAHRFAGNIERWQKMYPHLGGSAQLLQGDSRRLVEVVRAAGLVVSSPPYVGGGHHNDQTGAWGGAVGTGQPTGKDKSIAGYGQGNGQMGQMKEGDIQAVISSPPFAGNSGGRGEASRNGPSTRSGGPIDPGLFDRHSGGMKGGTGSDPANLDHLPMTPRNTRRGMGTAPMAIVSSPPYAESLKPETEEQTQRKQARIAKSKTLYDGRNLEIPSAGKAALGGGYGVTEGQLGAMVVGSPPFADSVGPSTSSGDTSDDPDKRGGLFRDEKRRNDVNLTGTYGETDGQLGGMKAGAVSAVIGSPPFENSLAGEPRKDNSILGQMQRGENKTNGGKFGQSLDHVYSNNPTNLGTDSGDTFWAAARLIVEQCYDILPPNACAIWVVKNYIKAGREVDFTGQWQALCEACGFETVHIHRAMLVKDNGEQETMAAGHDTTGTTTNLLGEEVTTAGKPMLNKKNIVARKSFFRRLAEKNGSPPIDFETILCMKKAA